MNGLCASEVDRKAIHLDVFHERWLLMVFKSHFKPSQAICPQPAQFTLDVYGHVTQKMRQESANRMQKFYEQLSSENAQ